MENLIPNKLEFSHQIKNSILPNPSFDLMMKNTALILPFDRSYMQERIRRICIIIIIFLYYSTSDKPQSGTIEKNK